MRSPIEMMVDKACGFNVEEARKKAMIYWKSNLKYF